MFNNNITHRVSNDVRNEIHQLTETEITHLIKLTTDPVFIKALRNKVLEAMLTLALTPVVSGESDLQFRLRMAHDQAYLEAYNDLLSDILQPIKEQDNG